MKSKSNTWGPRREGLSDISYRRSDSLRLNYPNVIDTKELDPWNTSLDAPSPTPTPTSTGNLGDSITASAPIENSSFQEVKFKEVGLEDNSSHNSDTIYLALALYSFVGNPAYYELSFNHMDAILVVNTDGDDGWWEAYTLGPISELKGINSWDSSAVDVSPEVWSRLRDTDPLRIDSYRILEKWKDENWQFVENCNFGFVPAAYTAVLASISRTITDEESKKEEIQPVIIPPVPITADPAILLDKPKPEIKKSIIAEYLPNKLLHRFHPFVTSGAEEFVLTNCEQLPTDVSQAISCLNSVLPRQKNIYLRSSTTLPPPINKLYDPNDPSDNALPTDVHVITNGPGWRKTPWSLKYSEVQISDPAHRHSWAGLYEWTVYRVTSTVKESSSLVSGPSTDVISVMRRFTHFKLLFNYLTRKFPILLVPELPDAQFSGRFRDQFIRKRMRGLQRWINRVVRHPVLGASEGVQIFLASGGFRPLDTENQPIEGGDEGLVFEESLLKIIKEDSVYGAKFLLNVYHPEFNITPECLDEEQEIFCHDLTGDSKTVQTLKEFLSQSTRRIEKLYSLLEHFRNNSLYTMDRDLKKISSAWRRFLVSGKNFRRPNAESFTSSVATNEQEQELSYRSSSAGSAHVFTREWCHKNQVCDECGHLTDAVQALSATYASVCENDSSYAVDKLVPIMEYIEEWSKMQQKLGYLLQVHAEASRIGKHLLDTIDRDIVGVPSVVAPSHIAARLQTVFNVVHAELDHWFHRDRLFEWSEIVSRMVDAELDRYQRSAMLFQGCKSIVSRSLDALDHSI